MEMTRITWDGWGGCLLAGLALAFALAAARAQPLSAQATYCGIGTGPLCRQECTRVGGCLSGTGLCCVEWRSWYYPGSTGGGGVRWPLL